MKALAALIFATLIGYQVSPPPQTASDIRWCPFGERTWPCARYVPPPPKPTPEPAPCPIPVEPRMPGPEPGEPEVPR